MLCRDSVVFFSSVTKALEAPSFRFSHRCVSGEVGDAMRPALRRQARSSARRQEPISLTARAEASSAECRCQEEGAICRLAVCQKALPATGASAVTSIGKYASRRDFGGTLRAAEAMRWEDAFDSPRMTDAHTK